MWFLNTREQVKVPFQGVYMDFVFLDLNVTALVIKGSF